MSTEKAAPSRMQAVSGDVWGGLAAMLVALPSAIAFGVLVFTAIGPEYAGVGATAGALGAAALGLTEPIVGRNGGFITAPCAPAAAVMSGLAGYLAVDRGLPAQEVIALMVLAALLAAAMQIIFGLVKLGLLIKYIPYQVVSGYLSGVAVIIALGQLPKLLGLPDGTHFWEGITHPDLWKWPGIAVGLTTIAITAGAPKVTTKIPSPILGLAAGIGVYFGIGLLFRPDLLSLVDNPLVVGPIEASGALFQIMVDRAKGLTTLSITDVELVFASAATLAVLLSIDTLKTGVVLDALTRTRHDSNRELIAQGAANVVSAFAGGMPGAGTMGPTLVNVTSGGRTPLSGFLQGAFAIIAFLALSQFIAWVPIGALAGILLVIAFRMFDWGAFKLLRHKQTRLDFAVIATVVLVAEGIGLIEASIAGVSLAILLFIRDQIGGSVVVRTSDLGRIGSRTQRLAGARELLAEHGEKAMMVELRGNLFFGTTDQLFSELADDLQTRRFILLDMRRVQSLDYTAGHLFHQMQEQLEERDGSLLFSGMPSSLPNRQDIEHYLGQLELVGHSGGIPIHEMRNDALEWMEEQLLEAAGWEERASDPPLEMGDIELFREFDADALAALASIAREVDLADGEELFDQGAGGDELCLIRSGCLEIVLPLEGGKRHHLASLRRGDYLGELAFLDRGKRSADVEAKGDTSLYVISRKEFDKVAHSDAIIGIKVFARLALEVSRRLRSANAEVRVLEER